MAKRTAQQHEKHLNALYNDIYSEEQAVDNFIYLTNKGRGKHTTERNIRNKHQRRELGTLLRQFDPISFYSSQND